MLSTLSSATHTATRLVCDGLAAPFMDTWWMMTVPNPNSTPLDHVYHELGVNMRHAAASQRSLHDQEAPPLAHERLAPDTIVAGRHVVQEWLTSEAISEIYRVSHKNIPSLSHDLKVLKCIHQQDAVLEDRIHAEASVISRLQSPYAVRLVDVGTLPDGRPFLCRESRQGVDLDVWMAATDHINEQTAALLAVELLIGLQELHHIGYVHAGLSPRIIALNEGSDRRMIQPRILDFSTLTCTTASNDRGLVYTRLKALATDHRYLAPELMYQYPTPAADIYSVGLLLSRMLYPVSDDAPSSRNIKIRYYENGKQGSLSAIIQKATARTPENRYQSATQMIEAIMEAMYVVAPHFAENVWDEIFLTQDIRSSVHLSYISEHTGSYAVVSEDEIAAHEHHASGASRSVVVTSDNANGLSFPSLQNDNEWITTVSGFPITYGIIARAFIAILVIGIFFGIMFFAY